MTDDAMVPVGSGKPVKSPIFARLFAPLGHESSAIWLLRVVVAAICLSASVFKMSGQPMLVQEFIVTGLGPWFLYATGSLELLGGVLILIPVFSLYGAVTLLAVDVAASLIQAFVAPLDAVHVGPKLLDLFAVLVFACLPKTSPTRPIAPRQH